MTVLDTRVLEAIDGLTQDPDIRRKALGIAEARVGDLDQNGAERQCVCGATWNGHTRIHTSRCAYLRYVHAVSVHDDERSLASGYELALAEAALRVAAARRFTRETLGILSLSDLDPFGW